MQLVEPCCAQKHLLNLREMLESGDTLFWHGYGDLSLAELLPALLIRYCETEMMVVAPVLPDVAAESVVLALRKQRAKMTGKGNLDVVAQMTIVADLSETRSPLASTWLRANPFPGRLILRNVQQNDTAILLPDIAFYGPMNLTYGRHFTSIVTRNPRSIQSLRTTYEKLS